MILVLDANIWISALFFGGVPQQVIEKTTREEQVIAICAEIEMEVRHGSRP